MQHWSLEQWLTLISALTAAIVSIINAFRGQRIERKVDAHEERATARAAMVMTAARPSSPTSEPATITHYPPITESMGIKPPTEKP